MAQEITRLQNGPKILQIIDDLHHAKGEDRAQLINSSEPFIQNLASDRAECAALFTYITKGVLGYLEADLGSRYEGEEEEPYQWEEMIFNYYSAYLTESLEDLAQYAPQLNPDDVNFQNLADFQSLLIESATFLTQHLIYQGTTFIRVSNGEDIDGEDDVLRTDPLINTNELNEPLENTIQELFINHAEAIIQEAARESASSINDLVRSDLVKMQNGLCLGLCLANQELNSGTGIINAAQSIRVNRKQSSFVNENISHLTGDSIVAGYILGKMHIFNKKGLDVSIPLASLIEEIYDPNIKDLIGRNIQPASEVVGLLYENQEPQTLREEPIQAEPVLPAAERPKTLDVRESLLKKRNELLQQTFFENPEVYTKSQALMAALENSNSDILTAEKIFEALHSCKEADVKKYLGQLAILRIMLDPELNPQDQSIIDKIMHQGNISLQDLIELNNVALGLTESANEILYKNQTGYEYFTFNSVFKSDFVWKYPEIRALKTYIPLASKPWRSGYRGGDKSGFPDHYPVASFTLKN